MPQVPLSATPDVSLKYIPLSSDHIASSSFPIKSKSIASLLQKSFPDPVTDQPLSLIPPTLRHGEPAFKIPQKLVDHFFQYFTFTLVGKFSHGRPMLEKARLCIAKFNLKGHFQLGHPDSKHILIWHNYD